MEPMETVDISQDIGETEQVNEQTADETGTEQTDTDTAEQPVNDFDPKAWGYKYRGQEIYPKDRNHLITLAQQGHMASQRMAELNARAKELDSMQKQFDPYKQLDEVFQKNPKFAQKIWDLYQKAQAGEDVTADVQDNGLGAIVQDINGIKTEFQKLKEEKEDQALEREIETLKTAHSDHEWGIDEGDGTLEKRILKHALDGGFSSLESAYRDMMWDSVRTNTEAKTLKQAAQNRVAEKKAGVIDKGGSAQRPQQNNSQSVRGMSWNKIAEAAISGL